MEPTSVASRPSRSSSVTTGTSAGLEAVEEARETAALSRGDAAGDGLGHDPARLDGEAGGADLLELVVGGLAGSGDMA